MSHELYALDFPNGKRYVGISQDATHRWRAHQNLSCQIVHRAIKKFGADKVSFRILAVGERAYILALEVAAIVAFDCRVPHGYNVGLGGEHSPVEGIGHSAASRAKMSESQKRRVRTPEELDRMADLSRCRKTTPEWRAKIAQSKIGIPRSAELQKRLSEANKTPEAIARHKLIHVGRKRSPETCAKIKAKRALQIITPEARAAMSRAQTARWARLRVHDS